MKNSEYFRRLDRIAGDQMDRRAYNQHKLRIWNPAAYPAPEVHASAVHILGCMTASREDTDQAVLVVGGSHV